ncbi:hypothetical protein GPA10_40965 [Streptomyces sp. p1417]|uniref:Uncharacterized protein n=1 Tax=Streptomyces typhae TaxID=2681492 RepID=A0A6L6XAZ1_9ACTN|nr:hypothetical protein [Streptomyces typhae]MVO90946.1 hypothetical protein [Streptomyces typhae]
MHQRSAVEPVEFLSLWGRALEARIEAEEAVARCRAAREEAARIWDRATAMGLEAARMREQATATRERWRSHGMIAP